MAVQPLSFMWLLYQIQELWIILSYNYCMMIILYVICTWTF